jgi:hypothetical protein
MHHMACSLARHTCGILASLASGQYECILLVDPASVHHTASAMCAASGAVSGAGELQSCGVSGAVSADCGV